MAGMLTGNQEDGIVIHPLSGPHAHECPAGKWVGRNVWQKFNGKNLADSTWFFTGQSASWIPSTIPTHAYGKGFIQVLACHLETEQVPALWQKVTVCNIPKPGSMNPEALYTDYCRISLISATLKVLLGVMAKQLSIALEGRGILMLEQASFRKAKKQLHK